MIVNWYFQQIKLHVQKPFLQKSDISKSFDFTKNSTNYKLYLTKYHSQQILFCKGLSQIKAQQKKLLMCHNPIWYFMVQSSCNYKEGNLYKLDLISKKEIWFTLLKLEDFNHEIMAF